jgi:hypothetical protein
MKRTILIIALLGSGCASASSTTAVQTVPHSCINNLDYCMNEYTSYKNQFTMQQWSNLCHQDLQACIPYHSQEPNAAEKLDIAIEESVEDQEYLDNIDYMYGFVVQ